MIRIKILTLCGIFLIVSLKQELYSQVYSSQVSAGLSLSEVALLDIEPSGTSISLVQTAPGEAGAPIQSVTDQSSWLNYSLCILETAADHFISVAISSGSVPSGLELSLSASSYSGSGTGTLGTPTGSIVLTPIGQVLISGIRGAHTGDGVNNGHQLTYSLSISDYTQVDFDQSTTIQLTFTITD